MAEPQTKARGGRGRPPVDPRRGGWAQEDGSPGKTFPFVLEHLNVAFGAGPRTKRQPIPAARPAPGPAPAGHPAGPLGMSETFPAALAASSSPFSELHPVALCSGLFMFPLDVHVWTLARELVGFTELCLMSGAPRMRSLASMRLSPPLLFMGLLDASPGDHME